MDTTGTANFNIRLEEFKAEIEKRRQDPDERRLHKERLAAHFGCVECCDDGYRIVEDSMGARHNEPCKACAPQRATERTDRTRERRSHYAELDWRSEKATFESFDKSKNKILADAWIAALNFATQTASHKWLLFLSEEPGTGKSHLAAAIVNYRIEHDDLPAVKWLTVPDWLDRMRFGFEDGSYHDTLDMALTAPCLVLDDLGAEYHRSRRGQNESWATERLYRVVNHRYKEGLETIITTNVPTKFLPRRLASRITDVGTGFVKLVLMETVSYRSGS